MNMNKELIMNKFLKCNAQATIKLLVLISGTFLLSACAGNNIVKMESSVEQLQDLKDLDRDGVIESREKCGGTALGASIDNYGCPRQTTYVDPLKLDIKFAHNTYSIPASGFPKIQKLASYLQRNSELKVVIEGHTSKVGTAAFNQVLSSKRAQAVKSVLVNEFKIDPQRVSSVGYGFERLENSADTEAAHATNRRIMAELSHAVNIDEMIWTIYTVDQAE
jgi:outer membrane protein OmpA-like peptidoglycan-associated protein